ncbi:hypothetical protein ORJ04_20655, partial [Rheinheimera baltica]
DWQMIGEDCGQVSAKDNQESLLLNINGAAQNGTLGFDINSRLPEKQTQQFVQAFEIALKAVTEQGELIALTGGIKSQSDFNLKSVSGEQLKALMFSSNKRKFIEPNNLTLNKNKNKNKIKI